jgi:hypothetical protein
MAPTLVSRKWVETHVTLDPFDALCCVGGIDSRIDRAPERGARRLLRV